MLKIKKIRILAPGLNSRKDGASLSSDDEDEDEIIEGEAAGQWLKDLFGECDGKGKSKAWHRAIFTCVYFISLAKGAEEIFPREKFPSSQLGMNFVKVEFVGVSLKLSLSGSRNGDVSFNKIMLGAKETAIGMIIKRI
ncbi:hypothetical protein Tco_1049390 [Tanacetum coccineum]